MGFQINTVKAQIGINTTKGEFSIRQPKGEQSITTEKTKLHIDSELPKVKIDQYQCFAEAGLKNYMDLTRENTQYATQKLQEAIQRYISDGDRMAMIGNNMSDAIPELAYQNSMDKEKVFDIGTIPKSRPKINVTGRLDISWDIGKANIEYKVNKPQINITKNKVEIYLKQKPSIEINYVNEKI